MINIWIIFLSVFLLVAISLALVCKIAKKIHILSPKGTPLIGGIAIGLSFALSCLFIMGSNGILTKDMLGIIVASMTMLVFGIIDDLRELSVPLKLFVQVIATIILIIFGIKTQIMYIGEPLNLAITIIWVIGISNVFNLLDIMDGVSSGVAIIVTLGFFIIAILNHNLQFTIMTLILTAAVCGFLIYNLPPARIYMGNSGSHFLGFVLAAVSIGIHYASSENKVALFTPFLVMGFPIFDTVFLILMRLWQKKTVFKKSNDHFAQRLLKLGVSKPRVLLFMMLLTFIFSSSGILLSQASSRIGIIILSGICILGLALIQSIGNSSLHAS